MNLEESGNAGEIKDEKISESIKDEGSSETEQNINILKESEIKHSNQCNQIAPTETENAAVSQNKQPIDNSNIKVDTRLKFRQLSEEYNISHKNNILLLKERIEEENDRKNDLLKNTELIEKSIAVITQEINEFETTADNDSQNTKEEVKVNMKILEEIQKDTINLNTNIQNVDNEIDSLRYNNKIMKDEILKLQKKITIDYEKEKECKPIFDEIDEGIEIRINTLQTNLNSEELLKQEHTSQISSVENMLDNLKKDFSIKTDNIFNKFNIPEDFLQPILNKSYVRKSKKLYKIAQKYYTDRSQIEQCLLQTIKSLDEKLCLLNGNIEEMRKLLEEMNQQSALGTSKIFDNFQVQEEQKALIRENKEELQLRTQDFNVLSYKFGLMIKRFNYAIAEVQKAVDEKIFSNKHDMVVQEKLSLERHISNLKEHIVRINELIELSKKRKEVREIAADSQSQIQTQDKTPKLN